MAKLPPQNLEAEEYVLGAIMLEKDKLDEVIDILPTRDHFYKETNAIVYDAILRLYRKNTPVDILTVTEELKKTDELEAAGGYFGVTKLTSSIVSSANVQAHAYIVKEMFVKREIIKTSGSLLAKAYNDSTDGIELIDELGSLSINLSEHLVTKQYRHIAQPLDELLAESVELSLQEIKFTGVPTGFNELDRISGGWNNSDLVILAARPSVGKTAFALNLLLNAASNEIKPTAVGMFSLEMSERQLLQRIVSNASGVEFSNIRSGNLQDWELERMASANETLKKLPFYIDDSFNLNMMQIKAKARRMKQKNDIGLILIDYLQLIEGESNKSAIREQEISKITRQLKGLAKELNIPIIALSQMSRAVESRGDNVPKLSDLRESGAIEQDADDVYFLYANSKDVLKKEPFRYKERHLKRAKARNGSLADLVYDFDGAHQRFENEDMTIEETHFVPIEKPSFKSMGEISSPINSKTIEEELGDDELPF